MLHCVLTARRTWIVDNSSPSEVLARHGERLDYKILGHNGCEPGTLPGGRGGRPWCQRPGAGAAEPWNPPLSAGALPRVLSGAWARSPRSPQDFLSLEQGQSIFRYFPRMTTSPYNPRQCRPLKV